MQWNDIGRDERSEREGDHKKRRRERLSSLRKEKMKEIEADRY